MGQYYINSRKTIFLLETNLAGARASLDMLPQQIVKAPVLRHFVPTADVHVMVFANEWALRSTLMQMHDGMLRPVRFCGRVLKESDINYHRTESEMISLLQLLKITHNFLAGKVIYFYTDSLRWNDASRPRQYMGGLSASLYHSPRNI